MSREVCGYCGLEVPCGCKGAPSDWIEWHGGEQPVADDVVVEVKLRSGIPSGWGDAKAAVWNWSHDGGECDIIAYRIVSQLSELDRLRKENAALREDAERYRWLRARGGAAWRFYAAHENPKKDNGILAVNENYDAAIDAARAALQGAKDD